MLNSNTRISCQKSAVYSHSIPRYKMSSVSYLKFYSLFILKQISENSVSIKCIMKINRYPIIFSLNSDKHRSKFRRSSILSRSQSIKTTHMYYTTSGSKGLDRDNPRKMLVPDVRILTLFS